MRPLRELGGFSSFSREPMKEEESRDPDTRERTLVKEQPLPTAGPQAPEQVWGRELVGWGLPEKMKVVNYATNPKY